MDCIVLWSKRNCTEAKNESSSKLKFFNKTETVLSGFVFVKGKNLTVHEQSYIATNYTDLSDFKSLAGDHSNEFFKVDFSVAIGIS